jgi:hypothetical protein
MVHSSLFADEKSKIEKQKEQIKIQKVNFYILICNFDIFTLIFDFSAYSAAKLKYRRLGDTGFEPVTSRV